MNLTTASLTLFNAVPVNRRSGEVVQAPEILQRTINHGYLLGPGVPSKPYVLDAIEQIIGISGEKMNASFHRSWRVVRESSEFELWLHQVVHYLTTYGFEQLGIFDHDTVYLPAEALNIPKLTADIPLTVVHALTPDELRAKVVALVESPVALSAHVLDAIFTIIQEEQYEYDAVKHTRNKELRAKLYDFYDQVPEDPVEFLRYVVNKLTGQSLLIKSPEVMDALRNANKESIDKLFRSAPKDLGSIFYRFKPLFLAMRYAAGNKRVFNQISRKAVTLHKPMSEDYLNSVTARIVNGTLEVIKLRQALEKANIFRKIRLAYALKRRMVPDPPDRVVYLIRNGKSWTGSAEEAQSPRNPANTYDQFAATLDIVTREVDRHIVEDLATRVAGKTIYIPDYVDYALPATEKQFVGNLPVGTRISTPGPAIFGVHWFNTGRRVDLDLSLLSIHGDKIGWDASYLSQHVTFSGDMTDAPKPKGATEAFRVEADETLKPSLLSVNYYNYDENAPAVPTRVFISQDTSQSFEARHGERYIADPNEIVASTMIQVDRKQQCVGLVIGYRDIVYLYTIGTSLQNRRSTSGSDHTKAAIAYQAWSLANVRLSLVDALTWAGAVVTRDPELADEADINLAPEQLSKTTILNLLQ